jgi:hypothetical protein
MASKSRKPPTPQDPAAAEAEKRLREFTAGFLADWRADEQFRKGMREDNDFYDGNQLSQEEREILQERGQPPVTINRIKPKLDAIFGMQDGMLVDTKAYAEGDREQEASDISEFFRRVEDDNDFDDKESLAFEDLCIAGRSWYKIGKRWDGLKSCHYIKKACTEDVVPDRNSREVDHSDAKRVHETVWMDLDDAQAMFPDSADKLAQSANDDAMKREVDSDRRVKPDQYAAAGPALTAGDIRVFADNKARRVRIVTTYYRTLTPRRYFYAANIPAGSIDITDMPEKDLATTRATYPNGQVVTQMEKKLHSYTFTWNAELEHLKDIREYDKDAKFPLIMMEGYRERNTSVNYGLVRQMKDPQREVNKRRSKHLHLISVNQTISEKGAFVNAQQAKEEVQKPDGWIELNPNSMGKFQTKNNLDLSQAHFMLLQQAVQEIDAAGVPRELEGRSNADSGRAFQLRQQQAVQGIRKLVSNLRSGRRRVGYYLLDEWNFENQNEAVQKYDILVEEAPDTLNLQQETFGKLISLAEKGMIPQGFLDLLIEVSDLDPAMKKKFLDRMQAMQQAQLQALAAQQQAAGGGAGAAPGAAGGAGPPRAGVQ